MEGGTLTNLRAQTKRGQEIEQKGTGDGNVLPGDRKDEGQPGQVSTQNESK